MIGNTLGSCPETLAQSKILASFEIKSGRCGRGLPVVGTSSSISLNEPCLMFLAHCSFSLVLAMVFSRCYFHLALCREFPIS